MTFTMHDFLTYFEAARQRTRRVASCVPDDKFEWTHKPDTFSPGDLVRHLAVTERWIWAESLHGRPSRYVAHGRELADGRDDVIAFLDRMHGESMELFRALPDDALTTCCPTPAGTTIVMWKWLNALLEHEAHHRGQLYSLLSMLGVEAPPLYGMTSQEVRRRGVPMD